MDKIAMLRKIEKMISTTDGRIGDTDPNIDDLTEDEIIEYEPDYWMMHRLLEIESYIKGT